MELRNEKVPGKKHVNQVPGQLFSLRPQRKHCDFHACPRGTCQEPEVTTESQVWLKVNLCVQAHSVTVGKKVRGPCGNCFSPSIRLDGWQLLPYEVSPQRRLSGALMTDCVGVGVSRGG